MPYAPGKACASVGCAGIAPHGKRVCEACDRERARQRRATQANAKKLYNSAFWKRVREVVLTEEPICMICQRNPSTDVDHKDGDYTNTARDNLQGLCHGCHSTKTAKEQGSFGAGSQRHDH